MLQWLWCLLGRHEPEEVIQCAFDLNAPREVVEDAAPSPEVAELMELFDIDPTKFVKVESSTFTIPTTKIIQCKHCKRPC